MHAFLFIGAGQKRRQEAIAARLHESGIRPADCVTLFPSGEHGTIDDVRKFASRLMLAPIESPHTAGIIYDAHTLTAEAQQAILKLVEEPPKRSILLCETQSAEFLLPTIISRCQIVRMGEPSEHPPLTEDTQRALGKLLSFNPRDLMVEVELWGAERTAARAWTRDMMIALRAHMLDLYKKSSPSRDELLKIAALIRRIMQAERRLEVNCQPKLTLDRVFLGN